MSRKTKIKFTAFVNDKLRKTIKVLCGMLPDKGAVVALVFNNVANFNVLKFYKLVKCFTDY